MPMTIIMITGIGTDIQGHNGMIAMTGEVITVIMIGTLIIDRIMLEEISSTADTILDRVDDILIDIIKIGIGSTTGTDMGWVRPHLDNGGRRLMVITFLLLLPLVLSLPLFSIINSKYARESRGLFILNLLISVIN